MSTVCSIAECEKPSRTRGWCTKHYKRWTEHGDPEKTLYAGSPEEAFERYTVEAGECLEWLASRDTGGYGQLAFEGRVERAHRAAWIMANGPIPEGLILGHICRNRACVKLGHLRLATRKQNNENIKVRVDSKSGIRGVIWHKRDLVWEVHARSDFVNYYGGRFKDVEEAEKAAIALRNRIFTHNIEKGDALARFVD